MKGVIKKVNRGAAFVNFVRFPYTLYKNYPNWVPPIFEEEVNRLSPAKNPFFKHADVEYYVAEKDGEIVGRIAAIVDHLHNEYHNERTGFFGFFESVNDVDVSHALFETVFEYMYKKGMDRVRGPMNPSQNDECGLLIEGFQYKPVIMMTYNPPYYRDLIEREGFKIVMPLLAFYFNPEYNRKYESVKKIVERLEERHPEMKVRPVNMKKLWDEARIIMHIYNEAWKDNWGFVPMTEEEFEDLVKKLKMIAVPDIALFGEISGKPVAFSLTLPDYNYVLYRLKGKFGPLEIAKFLVYKRRIKRTRLIILGVLPEYRKTGIDGLLYWYTLENGKKLGYKDAELSWILETNYMIIRSIKHMGGFPYKRYAIYEKEI